MNAQIIFLKRVLFMLGGIFVAQANLADAATSIANTGSKFKSGFYVGAQVGFSHMRGRMSETLHQQVSTAYAPSDSRSSTVKKSGPIGEFIAGYRRFLSNSFMVGGELAAGYSGQKVTSSVYRFYDPVITQGIYFNTSLKRTFVVTPSLVVGRVFTPNLLGFFKLGLGISQFKHHVKNVGENFNFRGKQIRYGVVPVLGLEYAISQRVSILGSVGCEFYQRVSKNIPAVLDQDKPGQSQYVFSTKPMILTAKVGFIVKI